jgi:hypothetical protein
VSVDLVVYFYNNGVHHVHNDSASAHRQVPDDGRTAKRSATGFDLLPLCAVYKPYRRRRHACLCWVLIGRAPVFAACSQHRHLALAEFIGHLSFVEIETTKTQAG